MSLLLDHFLILTDPGAPQAATLSEFGLVEGTSNDHPGQGTANRRFFFHNAALELGYVRDPDEALNGPAKRLRTVERSRDSGASPFGVILRALDDAAEPPFPGWRYYPDYFGPDMYFHIGENSNILAEPLCVVMPPNLPPRPNQPLSAKPFTIVTELRIGVPVSRPSRVLQAVGDVEGITVQLDVPHCMGVVFSGEREGSSRDFRPALPLVIHW